MDYKNKTNKWVQQANTKTALLLLGAVLCNGCGDAKYTEDDLNTAKNKAREEEKKRNWEDKKLGAISAVRNILGEFHSYTSGEDFLNNPRIESLDLDKIKGLVYKNPSKPEEGFSPELSGALRDSIAALQDKISEQSAIHFFHRTLDAKGKLIDLLENDNYTEEDFNAIVKEYGDYFKGKGPKYKLESESGKLSIEKEASEDKKNTPEASAKFTEAMNRAYKVHRACLGLPNGDNG